MKALVALTLAVMTLVSVKSHADIFDAQPAPDQYEVPGALVTEYRDSVIITIDGTQVESVNQLQDIFAKALHLPKTYGKNFDALYDVLTDKGQVAKDLDIGVIGGEKLQEAIGEQNLQKLLDVLNDAHEADPGHVSSIYWQ